MTWTYQQSTGELNRNGEFIGTGYSGAGMGRNNPDWQRVINSGPIPQGKYTIEEPITDPQLGPLAFALLPCIGQEMYGRNGFYIHGNNAANDASHGCIVLGPTIRQAIAESADRLLEVTE